MNIKAILLFFLLCFAPFRLIAQEEIRDLYFEIHNDDLKSLFESKGSLNKFDKFYCEVYWSKGRFEVVARADELRNELKQILKMECERKSAFAIPDPKDKFLSEFKFVENKGGWAVYRDDKGTSDLNEVLYKKSKKEIVIIEKRPTGTTRITYSYGKAKGKEVLEKVLMTSYEGTQNVTTKTLLKYKKVGESVLPVQVTVSTVQNLVKKDMGAYSRNLDEVFYFKNYAVNESKALLYFSKK